jgi:sortase A
MRKNKSIISTIVLLVILLVGLSVMLYPSFSDWWNNGRQAKAIANYQKKVTELSDDETQEILQKAHDYNAQLANTVAPLSNYDTVEGYDDILDITGTGIMGYISIPKIDVNLPIYHGTSASVLNIAVGHMQGTSLPVGGSSTHAVISAHRGLPSAKLFSDLDELVEGDEFTITVLKEVLTYRVEEIFIVEPTDVSQLNIIDGEDYVTLMTCTPYGVNSHRLLVRAKRTDTIVENEINITADAVQLDTLSVVPYIAAPLLFILLAFWIFGGKKKKKFSKNDILSAALSAKESDEETDALNKYENGEGD